jgi:serine protease AprX
MMRSRLFGIILCLAPVASAQQIGEGQYWIYFTDKTANGYQTAQPGEFLSERSINRRAWQGLGIDQTDEPVTRAYLDELGSMGVEIRHVSRWLNGALMVNASRELYEQVVAKPFVDTIPWEPETDEVFIPQPTAGNRFGPPLQTPPDFDYGIASEQVLLMDLEVLHASGYTGDGVWIGVLDAGFRNVDSLPSFEPMIREGRLLGTRNYVNDSSVYRLVNNHGMYVLSIMGADWPGNLMGTAPDASFFLCATENAHQETRIEEIAWIEGAEFLDSIGVDVFNTSLGYSDFDGTQFDYTYRDMDGRTTFISRAASMAAGKGILACVSAGNEGNTPWYYITAPGDAPNILTAGAVDSTGQIGIFSSRGPTFDGRVKPDVVTMGVKTGIQYVNGGLARGNGTSFSSPLLAGAAAVLWQAYPELPAAEMIQAIREAANRLDRPDPEYGYGLPSFKKAFWGISGIPAGLKPWQMEVYPNPATDRIMIRLPEERSGWFLLHYFDISGRMLLTQQVSLPGEVTLPGGLKGGLYILEITTPDRLYRCRLIME